MAASIKQQEQAHLDDVVSKIKVAQTKAQTSIEQAEADEKGIRDNFQNDLRLKTDSYTGMMETALSVRQQQQLLGERQNSWQHATNELTTLKKLEKNAVLCAHRFPRGWRTQNGDHLHWSGLLFRRTGSVSSIRLAGPDF